MVVEIFVAQGQTIETLIQEFLDGMIDVVLVAQVMKASRQTAGNSQAAVDLAEQQDPGITA